MLEHPDPAIPSEGLSFPSVARLELDELLDQLITRATEVKLTQGRLRGLLDATHHITAGLELDDLVQRIVENARALVGAHYAALGVVRDGRLIRFVHVGMDAATVACIGALPQGKGVLGCLIDDPKPLRLSDLGTHAAAVGFPEGHPPMHSFLGVPLRAGGTVYGNLYVTESERGDGFSAEDEQLLTALAGAAGIAVENALLLDAARRREAWQAASTRLASDLLAGELPPEGELQHLLEAAVDVAGAHGAAITEVADADPGVRGGHRRGRASSTTGPGGRSPHRVRSRRPPSMRTGRSSSRTPRRTPVRPGWSTGPPRWGRSSRCH